MEDNKSYWNPLFYTSDGTIGCPATLFGQLPLISIQRNWQMFFKLVDYLEFDSIQITVCLLYTSPSPRDS